MRHQAEIRGGILVAESRDGRSHEHEAGDGAACLLRQFPVRTQGCVSFPTHEAHVDVHAASGLPHRDLGGEADVQAAAESQVPDYPFGQKQLVCSRFHRAREELYLVLLIDFPVQGEVTHLAVAVFDLTARAGHMQHAVPAEVVKLGKGFTFMVALLVRGGEQRIRIRNHIVFQFSHGLELQSGGGLEGFLGP